MRKNGGMGFDYMIAEVTDVTGNRAEVKDRYKRVFTVRTDIRRGNGPKPKVGEVWVLDQTVSDLWSFAACLTPRKPFVITGSHDGQPVVMALLAVMEDYGFIIDNTSSEPIRARHNHGH